MVHAVSTKVLLARRLHTRRTMKTTHQSRHPWRRSPKPVHLMLVGHHRHQVSPGTTTDTRTTAMAHPLTTPEEVAVAAAVEGEDHGVDVALSFQADCPTTHQPSCKT